MNTLPTGSFKGRAVLITGASRGIGAALALAFAREGALVGVNFLNNAAAADAAWRAKLLEFENLRAEQNALSKEVSTAPKEEKAALVAKAQELGTRVKAAEAAANEASEELNKLVWQIENVVIDGVEFVIIDILFRMLKPAELARAMGFRDDFVWPKTKRDTVRMIGNAVSPCHARALIGAAMAGLMAVFFRRAFQAAGADQRAAATGSSEGGRSGADMAKAQKRRSCFRPTTGSPCGQGVAAVY